MLHLLHLYIRVLGIRHRNKYRSIKGKAVTGVTGVTNATEHGTPGETWTGDTEHAGDELITAHQEQTHPKKKYYIRPCISQ